MRARTICVFARFFPSLAPYSSLKVVAVASDLKVAAAEETNGAEDLVLCVPVPPIPVMFIAFQRNTDRKHGEKKLISLIPSINLLGAWMHEPCYHMHVSFVAACSRI